MQGLRRGMHTRSFTYIDDIVEGVVRSCDHVPTANLAWDAHRPDPATSTAPYRIYNIGNRERVALLRYIEILESSLQRKAVMEMLPMQSGDVPDTEADVDDLQTLTGVSPSAWR